MVSSDMKMANVVGGKSGRACDNCARKRARWYCADDDAFLCQSCDLSVHSANPLARRYDRVRMKSVSSIHQSEDKLRISVPSWHLGFSRKARSPRKKKHAKHRGNGPIGNCICLVPEVSSEENSQEENEEEILYRVPILDSCVAELGIEENEEIRAGFGLGLKPELSGFSEEMGFVDGLLPSEMVLAGFAADVESLLGNGFEDELFDIEGLGVLDDERERECCLGSERLKIENEDGFICFGREKFDFDFHNNCEEDYKENLVEPNFEDSNDGNKIFLRLDYEGIISAWDEHKSPWTTRERPELNFVDAWLGEMGVVNGHAVAVGGGGREARVSRYREKRRTRLFFKKIRYEVRKLNAEKRPRMKGRFVKRANFVRRQLSLCSVNKIVYKL